LRTRRKRAEILAPWNPLGSGKTFVDEIEGGEQEQGFVGLLVRSARLHRRDADLEVVEAFDGGIEKHGFRKAEVLLEGKEEIELRSVVAFRLCRDKTSMVIERR
jgi:hypothetical protein